MKLHILTYATDLNNIILKKSVNQLNSETLPVLIEWTRDFYAKSYSLYEKVKELNDEDLVLFYDAYDVLPVNGADNAKLLDKIIESFDLDKITMNAEKNCYPDRSLIPLYPQTSSPWKYLNCGVFVGKVKKVREILEVALPLIKTTGMDQAAFAVLFVENKSDIALDYECKVFQTLYMLDQNDLDTSNGKVKNLIFNTEPLLVHGNGASGIEFFLKH
jgi:hypothetical protein